MEPDVQLYREFYRNAIEAPAIELIDVCSLHPVPRYIEKLKSPPIVIVTFLRRNRFSDQVGQIGDVLRAAYRHKVARVAFESALAKCKQRFQVFGNILNPDERHPARIDSAAAVRYPLRRTRRRYEREEERERPYRRSDPGAGQVTLLREGS